jgi:hypothetical protein
MYPATKTKQEHTKMSAHLHRSLSAFKFCYATRRTQVAPGEKKDSIRIIAKLIQNGHHYGRTQQIRMNRPIKLPQDHTTMNAREENDRPGPCQLYKKTKKKVELQTGIVILLWKCCRYLNMARH